MTEIKQIKSPLLPGEEYLNKELLTETVKANKGIIDFTAEPLYSFKEQETQWWKLSRVAELLKGNEAVKTLKVDEAILEFLLPELLDCFADRHCRINSLVIPGTNAEGGNPSTSLKAILAKNTNRSLTAFYFPFNSYDQQEIKNILTLLADYKLVQHLDIHKRRVNLDNCHRQSCGYLSGELYDDLINFIEKNSFLASLDLGWVCVSSLSHHKKVLDTIMANVPWCAFRMLPGDFVYPDMTAVKEISIFVKTQKEAGVPKSGSAEIKLKSLNRLKLLPSVLNQMVLDYLRVKYFPSTVPSIVPYYAVDSELISLSDPVKFLGCMFKGSVKEEKPIWMAECFRQLVDKLCRYQDEAGLLATFQYLLKKNNVICASFPIPPKQKLHQADRWAEISDSIRYGLRYFLPIILCKLFKAYSEKDKAHPMVHLVLDDPMQSGLGNLIARYVVDGLLQMGYFLWGHDNQHCGRGKEVQQVDTDYQPYSSTALFLRIKLSDYRELHQRFNLASYGLPEHPPVFTGNQEAKGVSEASFSRLEGGGWG